MYLIATFFLRARALANLRAPSHTIRLLPLFLLLSYIHSLRFICIKYHFLYPQVQVISFCVKSFFISQPVVSPPHLFAYMAASFSTKRGLPT